ncbi:hypothetical protein PchlO6_5018 [Pseudomonas chlororaphis O6]|uniref:Uncharacterized protein n=1 Tax=Pseudomonas chlororaphis O6 TaxID=1037915 RepID=A0AB33WKI1_9PSED|nr:hypothetical protein PchlO6_5018 [Pseudomonas chlororaphis O6]
MQILNPQKSGVPRVPCVPTPLKPYNFGALSDGTQMACRWNTWAMEHKRCSRIGDTGKQDAPALHWWPHSFAKRKRPLFFNHGMGRGVNIG